MLKNLTIIETASDSESPMIGTIDNVTLDKIGSELFIERLMKALAEHFDAEITITPKAVKKAISDIFTGSPFEDLQIIVDETEYSIRILETWIY